MGSKLQEFAIASTVFLAGATGVAAQDTIEQDSYAANVANYLTENCPSTVAEAAIAENFTSCLNATLSATYGVAAGLSTFITEAKVPTQPFRAGMSNGELLRGCEIPAQRINGTEFSSLQAHTTAIADFARSCIPSIRRAGENVDLDWEPTAVNTLANHVNCLTGNECISLGGTGSPLRITVQP